MRALLLCALFCFVIYGQTEAQIIRGKTVQFVVGFPAGSNTDLMARPLAQKLSELTGAVFVVINRPGATGIIANDAVAKAKPDGSVLLIAPSSSIASVPHLHANMPYDSLTDLVPVVQVAMYPSVLISHPSVPVKTIGDLVKIARSRPHLLTFGSSGIGSTFHLSGELFKQVAAVDMLHIPYSGIVPALTDLIGGHIDILFATYQVIQPFLGTGKLRIIAVTGLARDPLLAAIPTIQEAGVHGFEAINWIGIFAPRNVPPSALEYLNTSAQTALVSRELKTIWKSEGLSYSPNDPRTFVRIVRESYVRYGLLIAQVGIKPE